MCSVFVYVSMCLFVCVFVCVRVCVCIQVGPYEISYAHAQINVESKGAMPVLNVAPAKLVKGHPAV